MPRVSGPYLSSGGGSRTWMIVALLLALALLATVIALAFALGFVRLPDGGPVAGASPSPTSVAVSTPSPSPATSPSAPPSVPATAAPTQAPSMGPTPGGIHVVQSGETLFSIGLLYGVPWQLIAEANNIENPDHIELGQEIVIPVPAPPSAGAAVHYVQPGESIFSIAELYGVTPTELADANGIVDWDLIYVGQELVIPGVAPTASP